jgi:transposase
MKQIDPIALFRLSVLGPLVSRAQLARGQQKAMLRELSEKDYDIPGSRRRQIAEKTLQEWLYRYRREGLEGLVPKPRADRGLSKLSGPVQERLLAAKRENPRRSIRVLRRMLEHEGLVARGALSRSAIHRFLNHHGLSRPAGAATVPEERRSFLAECANDIWYGDVMHGPRALVAGRARKTYLVSLMDDASRLIAHSAFCLSETALEIEGVLNARLWAWIEASYHRTPHAGLAGLTPLARYQQDLAHIRLLGPAAAKLDELFRHRIERLVRKDGTVSYGGRFFEVPYELAGKTVHLVIDPHTRTAIGVEDEAGTALGAATALDALANRHRRRHRPVAVEPPPGSGERSVPTLIDHACADYYRPITDDPTSEDK